ncbi:MAG: hypothetical protein KC492_16530 [Myxococcales bacterium]|nr:hypothetical protein [Myxococcales bacterium]
MTDPDAPNSTPDHPIATVLALLCAGVSTAVSIGFAYALVFGDLTSHGAGMAAGLGQMAGAALGLFGLLPALFARKRWVLGASALALVVALGTYVATPHLEDMGRAYRARPRNPAEFQYLVGRDQLSVEGAGLTHPDVHIGFPGQLWRYTGMDIAFDRDWIVTGVTAPLSNDARLALVTQWVGHPWQDVDRLGGCGQEATLDGERYRDCISVRVFTDASELITRVELLPPGHWDL